MRILFSIFLALCCSYSRADDINAARPPEAFETIGALTIPRIDAQNVTLAELLELLSAQTRQLDPSELNGISIFATGFDRVNSDNDASDAINNGNQCLPIIGCRPL